MADKANPPSAASIYATRTNDWKFVARGSRGLALAWLLDMVAGVVLLLQWEYLRDVMTSDPNTQMFANEHPVAAFSFYLLLTLTSLGIRFYALVNCANAPIQPAAKYFLLAICLFVAQIVASLVLTVALLRVEILAITLTLGIKFFAQLTWRIFWFAGVASITAHLQGLSTRDVRDSRVTRGFAMAGIVCAFLSVALLSNSMLSAGRSPAAYTESLSQGYPGTLLTSLGMILVTELCLLVTSLCFAELISRQLRVKAAAP